MQKGNVVGVCAVHVDDIYFSGIPNFMEYFQYKVAERFKVKDAKINDIMHTGLRVRKMIDGDVIVASEDHGKNIEEIQIRPERQRDLNAILIEEEKDFRSQLGKIMWLARITRADITYEAAAVAQAFAEAERLEQNYEPFLFGKTQEIQIETAKPNEEKIPLDNLGNFDHLVDFEKFSENKNNEWVNKINLKKKVVKNTGDNFKTSLRIKN